MRYMKNRLYALHEISPAKNPIAWRILFLAPMSPKVFIFRKVLFFVRKWLRPQHNQIFRVLDFQKFSIFFLIRINILFIKNIIIQKIDKTNDIQACWYKNEKKTHTYKYNHGVHICDINARQRRYYFITILII